MWNEAAKRAATRQVIQPPPCPAKAVEPNTAMLGGEFNQYTLLNWLTDAKARSKLLDDAMIIDKPVKPTAGSSRHPDDKVIVDGELRY